jgi:hypothetical protein
VTTLHCKEEASAHDSPGLASNADMDGWVTVDRQETQILCFELNTALRDAAHDPSVSCVSPQVRSIFVTMEGHFVAHKCNVEDNRYAYGYDGSLILLVICATVSVWKVEETERQDDV